MVCQAAISALTAKAKKMEQALKKSLLAFQSKKIID
jgi:hypothetical protein